MKVTLRYFALAAELAGRSEETLDLAAGATAGDALSRARELHPALAHPGFTPLLAVNRRHAEPSWTLSGDDEIALFPPVSGG